MTMKIGFILPFLLVRVALAQSPGTFTPTGSMATARMGNTATLLPNGKVLIAGGGQFPPSTVLASAELYDPATATFSVTGSMTTPRIAHTATLLADGRVLITGGDTQVGPAPALYLASAEIYDPSIGIFTAAGEMTMPRAFHTATLLSDGRVLIAGGSSLVADLATAELYDPSTGTFTATGTMTTPQSLPTSTLLANGKVLIQGGTDSYKPDAELFDPGTGTFAPTGLSAIPYLWAATANLLTNGEVLDTLTDGCGDPYEDAELYDPSAGIFAAVKMTAFRRNPTATLLADGTVLIAGGGESHVTPPLLWSVGVTNGAEIYDPATGQFSPTGDMAQNREDHTATLLPDGTALVAGGWTYGIGSTATAEIYHPKVLIPSPALFSLSGDGKGPGAILHAATQQVVSSTNPAVAGEALEIYGAGLIDGSVIPPQVAIGGRAAEVLWFGQAPGYAGLNQINVRVPGGVAPGSAVSVRLNYLSRPSNEVTIAVQ